LRADQALPRFPSIFPILIVARPLFTLSVPSSALSDACGPKSAAVNARVNVAPSPTGAAIGPIAASCAPTLPSPGKPHLNKHPRSDSNPCQPSHGAKRLLTNDAGNSLEELTVTCSPGMITVG